MTIYEFNTTLTVQGGSNNAVSHNIVGGRLQYLLIRANTATTIFRADLRDDNGIVRLRYDFHEGEIVDDKINFPMTGKYTVDITNSSPNDTFRVLLSLPEA